MILPDFSAGRTVIVAGGPSLAGFDWRRLDGERVIAINRACEVLPHADVLWWSDAGFARRHGRALADHPAPVKATGRRGREPVHGMISDIRHDGRTVFARLDNPMVAPRYHTLVGDPAGAPAQT